MAAADPWLSILEASALCGCSPDTIRRRIRTGSISGARRDPGAAGRWTLRRSDLVRAGLCDEAEAAAAGPEPVAGQLASAQSELDRLRRDLERLQDRLEAVQALADERADRVRFLERLFDSWQRPGQGDR